MFDIKALEEEVTTEMQAEAIELAKERLVSKLQDIKRAERVVTNLKREYDALRLEITEDIG